MDELLKAETGQPAVCLEIPITISHQDLHLVYYRNAHHHKSNHLILRIRSNERKEHIGRRIVQSEKLVPALSAAKLRITVYTETACHILFEDDSQHSERIAVMFHNLSNTFGFNHMAQCGESRTLFLCGKKIGVARLICRMNKRRCSAKANPFCISEDYQTEQYLEKELI